MKTKIKNITKVTVIFLFLSMAFNNCGQPGELRFDKLNSTQDAKKNDNSVQETPPSGNQTQPVGDPPAEISPVVIPPAEPPNNGGVGTEEPPVLVVNPPPVILPPAVEPPGYEQKTLLLNVSSVEKVDILFVIDNSVSMNFEQANMAQRFGKFINSLQDLDWQIGIVTTDVSDPYLSTSDGKLLKFESLNTYILDSSMSKKDVEKAFAETIQRKEKGSGYEQGVFATYRFLEREDSRSRKLLRAGAAFSVVIVSDANETPFEDSYGRPIVTLKNKPVQLIKYLEKKWPNKPYQFHSIVVKTNDQECLDKNGNELYGEAYIYLSHLTKGIVGSVCEDDYGSQLKVMGEKVQELVGSVLLECAPVDANHDGVVDVKVTSESGDSIEVLKIEGKSLFFKKNLPAGKVQVLYQCLK